MQSLSEAGIGNGASNRAGVNGGAGHMPGVRPFTMKTVVAGTLVSDAAQESANGTGEHADGEDKKNGVARLEFTSIEESEIDVGDLAVADALAELKAEVAGLETKLVEQKQAALKQVEEARLLARLLARKEWEEEMDRRSQEGRVQIRRACEEFDRERTRYFAAVEGQVVKLALAIAGRVLHREAKMDPLLLSAAVRVALEKVKDESETRLRVPVVEVDGWNAAFNINPDEDGKNVAGGVQVVGDSEMARGECVIETSVGTVELGIAAQLLEIEQGFFDLLRKRPA